MTVWVGIDLVARQDVEDALSRHGRRYLERVFSDREIAEAGGNSLHLAARFAAKEATAKALRAGEEPWRWRDIEVHTDAAGPRLYLHGAARELAERRGVSRLALSFTHRRGDSALAVVLATANAR